MKTSQKRITRNIFSRNRVSFNDSAYAAVLDLKSKAYEKDRHAEFVWKVSCQVSPESLVSLIRATCRSILSPEVRSSKRRIPVNANKSTAFSLHQVDKYRHR